MDMYGERLEVTVCRGWELVGGCACVHVTDCVHDIFFELTSM